MFFTGIAKTSEVVEFQFLHMSVIGTSRPCLGSFPEHKDTVAQQTKGTVPTDQNYVSFC